MAINQVKYYLYILQKKGLDITEGIINIPTKKITEKVVLQEEDICVIEDRLKMINDVIDNTEVPKVNRIPACSNCAYYELCFI
jgi:CRISPR-associated exonuclease Cas4